MIKRNLKTRNIEVSPEDIPGLSVLIENALAQLVTDYEMGKIPKPLRHIYEQQLNVADRWATAQDA